MLVIYQVLEASEEFEVLYVMLLLRSLQNNNSCMFSSVACKGETERTLTSCGLQKCVGVI